MADFDLLKVKVMNRFFYHRKGISSHRTASFEILRIKIGSADNNRTIEFNKLEDSPGTPKNQTKMIVRFEFTINHFHSKLVSRIKFNNIRYVTITILY